MLETAALHRFTRGYRHPLAEAGQRSSDQLPHTSVFLLLIRIISWAHLRDYSSDVVENGKAFSLGDGAVA